MNTKERIIATAIDLFNLHGTKAISTNHIAKEMGISPGNLYYHFRSKNDIIRSISDNFSNELGSVFNIQLDTIPDFSSNLTTLFNRFFKIQQSYQFLFLEGVHLTKQDSRVLDNYTKLRRLINKGYHDLLSNLVKIKIMKRQSLNIIDDLLDAQWIIMWYWINHTILDRNTYDDSQIKKGIKLSFSIIKPQLTSIGKVAFDRTLQTL
ncbi:MAG: TetR/AcrR family transcriptional regulator [Candidatus Marinimicrobia bacterium]|jgi:AcrR family transcriptional regulator|nr:TetR/AcrR family transcriptional regulator [Candidatus Neomarinimicrobiota bacterium]MDP7330045.1 TetR/AcrR family transcriptional regulator [Candidatus Neomarinimicrobiota bacterium]MDP7565364.1 TetR/AcrR family transcriptional regulator [Candidatus Neomarinimicrobiota bacterium]|tara:strand:+ start:95 stop:715 length:621 start_codon:yes stop_codon:yes gene_type:complete